jgi:hypothetical protein
MLVLAGGDIGMGESIASEIHRWARVRGGVGGTS